MTRQDTDELLPTSENVAIIVEPPTDEEVNAAITGNMGHLVTVVSADLVQYVEVAKWRNRFGR